MRPATQATQAFKSLEVTVTVQQGVVMLDAEAGHQHVYATAYREPSGAQASVMLGCRLGEPNVAGIDQFQAFESLRGLRGWTH